MGFVEVDLSMVSQAAEPHARGPSRGVKAHMHGDVDWASIDFDRVCHYRVEVTTAEVRGAGTSGRVEITFIGDRGVSPPIPSNTTPTRAPVSCAAPRFPSESSTTARLANSPRSR